MGHQKMKSASAILAETKDRKALEEELAALKVKAITDMERVLPSVAAELKRQGRREALEEVLEKFRANALYAEYDVLEAWLKAELAKSESRMHDNAGR